MAIKLVFVLQDTAGLIAQDNVSTLHARSSEVHGGSCSMFSPLACSLSSNGIW